MTTEPLIIILMGSKADLNHCEKIVKAAQSFGIEAVMRVGSAHKTAEHVLNLLEAYEADPRPKVFITVAGRSNALSGFTDGAVSAPVIACPPPSEAYGGADIYSSLRIPSGIAPGVVVEPANAALLAAKILGLVDPQVRAAVQRFQQKQSEKIFEDDGELKSM
jgi:5-(carboxyamino)imidazole ribonucleotide mutase